MKEDADEKADHEEVIATANKRQDHLKAFVKEMVIGMLVSALQHSHYLEEVSPVALPVTVSPAE